MEEEFREWRGEGKTRVYRSAEEGRQQLNKWVDCLAKHKAAMMVKKGGEASELPEQPLPPPLEEEPPAVPKAGTPGGEWGCYKCRYRITGCGQCCPWKAARYHTKKLEKAGKGSKDG